MSAMRQGARACRNSWTATSVPLAPPPTIATSTGPMGAKVVTGATLRDRDHADACRAVRGGEHGATGRRLGNGGARIRPASGRADGRSADPLPVALSQPQLAGDRHPEAVDEQAAARSVARRAPFPARPGADD